MTTPEAIAILEAHNLWRRDNTDTSPMQDSQDIGIALDIAIEVLKEREVNPFLELL